MIKIDKLISNVRDQIDEMARNDTKFNITSFSQKNGFAYESMKFELTNSITNNIVDILNNDDIKMIDKLTKIISPLVYTSMCNFVMEYNTHWEKTNE